MEPNEHSMKDDLMEQIRENLTEKRDTLETWLNATPPQKRTLQLADSGEEAVTSHLHTLDSAVQHAADGTLGTCEVCHDTINRGLLEMDYTCCVCLDHLSESEARSLEFEIELAQTVQRSLLPQEVPDTEYLEIAAFSRPAQFISGDYFDFFRFRDGAHGLAIADVAGHGISASLHMASLQALLRTLIPISDSAAEVVDRLQGLLVHNVRFSNFVTLFLGAYDEASHRLVYANAGHNPPLVLRRDPKVPDLRRDEAVKPDTGPDEAPDGGETWLWPTGPAVGLIEHPGYTTGMLQLYPGDLVLMYTDGVTEAENPSGQQYDRPRLAQAVRRFRRLPARDLVHSILEDLQAYTAGKPLADDATLLACRIVR